MRRANSARRWLINKGIDSKRIQAKGYGETVILNNCSNGEDCTDDEHRFNRRTEFKILEGPTSIEVRKEVLNKKGKASKNNWLRPTFDKAGCSYGRLYGRNERYEHKESNFLLES